MGLGGYIFLVIVQFLTGRGILHLFKMDLKPLAIFALSMILGVVTVSLYPFMLALVHIPITKTNVLIIILALTALINIPVLKRYKLSGLNPAKIKFNIELYELPYLLVFAVMMFVSAWKCFYWPLYARDMLSGPEAVAEFTVREHTLVNSIYSLNLESTNNHLKPPFVTDLQVIYKMFVSPFGEVWLSLIVIPFLIWMYVLLKEKLHPIVASLIMLFFICMPDLYAYTFIVLFDYSNMVFFFAGFYFLSQYFQNKQYNYFLFGTLMFGFSTYIRPETLILIGMTLPLLYYYFRKDNVPVNKMVIRAAIYMFVPFVFYYIWVGIFVKYYLPVPFDVANQINPGKVPFWDRLTQMTRILIFGISDDPNQTDLNLRLYGYFMYVFMAVFVTDIIFFRKRFNTEARVMLYGILVVYFGLPFLGYLIPLVDLQNTTKRGLYKMFPLMLIYMRNSGLLNIISDGIKNWEVPQLKPVKPAPKPQPVVQQPKNKKGK